MEKPSFRLPISNTQFATSHSQFLSLQALYLDKEKSVEELVELSKIPYPFILQVLEPSQNL